VKAMKEESFEKKEGRSDMQSREKNKKNIFSFSKKANK
jgi:hypothetical protein